MATTKKTRDEVQKIVDVYVTAFRGKRVKSPFAVKIDNIFNPYLVYGLRMERSRTNASKYLATLVKDNPTPEEIKKLDDETDSVNAEFDALNREIIDVPEFMPKEQFLELVGDVYDISAQDLHYLYNYKTDAVTDDELLWTPKKTTEPSAAVAAEEVQVAA